MLQHKTKAYRFENWKSKAVLCTGFAALRELKSPVISVNGDAERNGQLNASTTIRGGVDAAWSRDEGFVREPAQISSVARASSRFRTTRV